MIKCDACVHLGAKLCIEAIMGPIFEGNTDALPGGCNIKQI